MQRSWRTLLPLAALAALIGYLYVGQQRAGPPPAPAPTAVLASNAKTAGLPAFLPPQASATLALIARGGPFPHPQDGEVFGNYEHLLPNEPRGYYHEYTVETPGARTRGARRIITGGNPPNVYYYTDDHYRSFRRFSLPP
jgi:guanyl-specific ribonuclease Sa